MTLFNKGLAQWLRSLPPNPEVPGSIPGLVEGWIFGRPSFPLKFTQLSILPGSVKWVPAYMDRFEAAARGAYICFRSAGGKLIIVKRLWACYMEKALYKCTTLLLLYFKDLGLRFWLFIYVLRVECNSIFLAWRFCSICFQNRPSPSPLKSQMVHPWQISYSQEGSEEN